MTDRAKELVAWLTPAVYWLVRRALPIIAGAVGVKGIESESAMQTVTAVIIGGIGFALMAWHNRKH